eukprot:4320281-Prymnesium_polylepis.1
MLHPCLEHVPNPPVHETPAFCVLARTCRSPVPALLFRATICFMISGVSCDHMLRAVFTGTYGRVAGTCDGP